MKRRAEAVAVAVGAAMVGGLILFRFRAAEGATAVTEQGVVGPRGEGNDAWAGVAFRVLLSASMAERSPSVEVLDAQGARYPLVKLSDGRYVLPFGYKTPIVGPYVRVFVNSETLARLPLEPLPGPKRAVLTPTSPPAFRATFRSGNRAWGHPDAIELVPLEKTPFGRSWEVSSVRTSLSPGIGGVSVGVSYPPYAKDIDALEFTATQIGSTVKAADVTLEGFRLERRGGRIAVVVDRPIIVSNALGQAVAPVQKSLPHPATSAPAFPQFIETSRDGRTIGSPRGPLPRVEEGRRARLDLSVARSAYAVLSPRPEELGLRELTVGDVVLRSAQASVPPLRLGPFAVRLRLSQTEPRRWPSTHHVVRVQPGSPQPKPTYPASYYGEWSDAWPRPLNGGEAPTALPTRGSGT